MSKQTWTITASPRERLQLAIALLHRDLVIKGRAEERRLYRAREALGLLGISETLLSNGYQVSAYGAEQTRHRFTVTAENAEWILQALEPLPINAALALWIEPLLRQLEARADAPDADTALTWDDASERPLWIPAAAAPPERDPRDDEPIDVDPEPTDETPETPEAPDPRDSRARA